MIRRKCGVLYFFIIKGFAIEAIIAYIIMLNKTICQLRFSTLLNNKIFKQGLELTKFKLSLLNGIVTVGAYSLYPAAASCLPLLASTVALSMSSQALNQYIEI